MQRSTYLLFGGDCEAAFRFYEQLLGGKIEMIQTHGDSLAAADLPAHRFLLRRSSGL